MLRCIPMFLASPLRRTVSELLEQGSLPNLLASPLARAYSRVASSSVCRPLRLPESVPVVAVGGAVLGGSGKTPVALELARILARSGARVALVSHAYRARPSLARQVRPDDPVDLVGDDALVAARELSSRGVCTWVGPSRQAALDAAARHSEVVVIDGLLQASPDRVACSVLVLDADRPWGAGQCPPAGNLRASPEALLRAADQVLLVRDPMRPAQTPGIPLAGSNYAELNILGARRGKLLASLQDLHGLRLGVLLLVGTPDRILASLRARNVRWDALWLGGDHQRPGRVALGHIRQMARSARLGAWLVTPKCGTHLQGLDLGAPVWELETSLRLDHRPETVVDCAPCVRRECSLQCSHLPCCPFRS